MTPIEVRLKLSDREFEVARLKHQGYKTSQIAEKLKISPKRVSNLLNSTKKKIGREWQNPGSFRTLGDYALDL